MGFKEGDFMLSIAICDDEKSVSEKIEKMAKDFFRKKNIDISVVKYSSGEELLGSSQGMDILFLDIQMEDMDGMETARELRNRKFKGTL